MSLPETFISVFARNCVVRRIDRPCADAFIGANHRYGTCRYRYCYGLFTARKGHDGVFREGELVAVSCFSTARRWKIREETVSSFEWVRYASLQGVRVIGGMGKTLRAFVNDVRPDDIMSYAPLDSDDAGDVYVKLGFTLEGIKDFGTVKSAKFRLKLKNY